MTMNYNELTQRLRKCVDGCELENCPLEYLELVDSDLHSQTYSVHCLAHEAADAIEELQAQLKGREKMAEYIDREAVRKMLDDWAYGYSNLEIFKGLEAIPAADVAPVRHGKWERKERGLFCSECGLPSGFISKISVEEDGLRVNFMTIPFCPHCGARMDGDT